MPWTHGALMWASFPNVTFFPVKFRKYDCFGFWAASSVMVIEASLLTLQQKKMGPAWGFFEVRSSSKVKLAALSTMNITHTHGMSHSWVGIYSSSYQCSVLSSVSTIWEFQLDIGRWPLNVHIFAIFARISWHACGNKWPHQASGQTTSTSCKNVQAGEGMTWWQVKPR